MIEEYRLPDGRTVKETLLAMQADSNKEFAARLNPGIENVLGLRIPQLRKLAKIIARHQCEQYLSAPGDFYMEERMLHGMVLGEIDMDDIDGYLQRVAVFVRSINSWSVCDTFDFKGKRRLVERYPSLIRQWLLQWLDSDREYGVRFAVVMFMKYFIGQGNPSDFLQLMAGVKHRGYYVSMAVAWGIATAMAKYPDDTIAWLAGNPVDRPTMKRAIQKSLESFRISAEHKAILRTYR